MPPRQTRISALQGCRVTLSTCRGSISASDRYKHVASMQQGAVSGCVVTGFLCPRSMTGGAQQALRRTMEIYSSTTRFALACNTSSKIIEPIQSRCAIVRFTKLGEKDLLERLLHVCQHEKVPCRLAHVRDCL